MLQPRLLILAIICSRYDRVLGKIDGEKMTLWRTPVIKLCRRFQSSISVHEVFQSLKERDLVHQHTKYANNQTLHEL